jgi:hypothetical protein
LRAYLTSQDIDVEIDAAAEYYLDEQVFKMIENDQKMLTFGEISCCSKPIFSMNLLT